MTEQQKEILDKDALLEWLKIGVEKMESIYDSPRADAYGKVIAKIESGTFDDHSTQAEIAKLKHEWISPDTARALMDDIADKNEKNAALEARAIQAEQERDTWKKHTNDFEQMYKDEHAEKNRLVRERNALLEGMKWYADDSNWIGMVDGSSNIHVDGGIHARSIIAKIEGRNLNV